MHNAEEVFLTVQEVSSLLRLNVLTIYKYIREQKLEAIAFGRHYRIKRSSLESFIEEHKVQKGITSLQEPYAQNK